MTSWEIQGRERGNVQGQLNDSYAHLAYIHMNNHGLIRHRSQAA